MSYFLAALEMSTKPAATPEANFVTLCERVLDALSSMIKDARDNLMSEMDPSQLDTTRNMLSLAKPTDLVVAFIKKKEHWKKIETRSMPFLEKEIGVLFADSGILEAKVVEEPIRVYLALKKWKNDASCEPQRCGSKKIVPTLKRDDPFINDEDIGALWKKFALMIKLSCKWNAANGNKYDLKEFNHYLTQ